MICFNEGKSRGLLHLLAFKNGLLEAYVPWEIFASVHT
jgi:hypothetical protein